MKTWLAVGFGCVLCLNVFAEKPSFSQRLNKPKETETSSQSKGDPVVPSKRPLSERYREEKLKIPHDDSTLLAKDAHQVVEGNPPLPKEMALQAEADADVTQEHLKDLVQLLHEKRQAQDPDRALPGIEAKSPVDLTSLELCGFPQILVSTSPLEVALKASRSEEKPLSIHERVRRHVERAYAFLQKGDRAAAEKEADTLVHLCDTIQLNPVERANALRGRFASVLNPTYVGRDYTKMILDRTQSPDKMRYEVDFGRKIVRPLDAAENAKAVKEVKRVNGLLNDALQAFLSGDRAKAVEIFSSVAPTAAPM